MLKLLGLVTTEKEPSPDTKPDIKLKWPSILLRCSIGNLKSNFRLLSLDF